MTHPTQHPDSFIRVGDRFRFLGINPHDTTERIILPEGLSTSGNLSFTLIEDLVERGVYSLPLDRAEYLIRLGHWQRIESVPDSEAMNVEGLRERLRNVRGGRDDVDMTEQP